jgi:uncharacterized protein
MITSTRAGRFFAATLVLMVAAIVFAQDAYDVRENYTKTEHMVPMRDGVKLFTIVYSPKNQAEEYPLMLHRTPYGSPPYGAEYRRTLGPWADFAKEGLIFVYCIM